MAQPCPGSSVPAGEQQWEGTSPTFSLGWGSVVWKHMSSLQECPMQQSCCSLQQGPAALIRSAGISTLPQKAVSWLGLRACEILSARCALQSSIHDSPSPVLGAGCMTERCQNCDTNREKHPLPHTNSGDVMLEHLLPFLCKKLSEVGSAFPSDAASQGENGRKGNNSSCRCMSE